MRTEWLSYIFEVYGQYVLKINGQGWIIESLNPKAFADFGDQLITLILSKRVKYTLKKWVKFVC